MAIEQPPNTLNDFDNEIIETQTVFIMPKSSNTSLIQQIFENYENVDTDIQDDEGQQYMEQRELEDVGEVEEAEDVDEEEHVEVDVEEEHVEEEPEEDEEENVENSLEIELDTVPDEEEHAIVLDVVEKCIEEIVTNNDNTDANVDATMDDVINNNT
jgi:hypothetical protein